MRKITILFFLHFIFLLGLTKECAKWIDESFSSTMDGYCTYSNSSHGENYFNTNYCNSSRGMVCDWTTNDKYSSPCNFGKYSINAGKRAANQSLCKSNMTDGLGFCSGKPFKSECSDTGECEVGLFCYNKLCIKSAELGEYCDNSGHKCNSYLFCYNNTCQPLGTLKNGTEFNHKLSSESSRYWKLFCETGWLDKDDLTCQVGPKFSGPSKYDDHRMNDTSEHCYFSYRGSNYSDIDYEYPQCGYSKDGFCYCKGGEGDLFDQFKEYLSFMQKKPNCTIGEVGSICEVHKDMEGFQEAYGYYLKITDWEHLYDLPTEMRKYYLPDYDDDFASSFAFPFLCFTLFLSYLF